MNTINTESQPFTEVSYDYKSTLSKWNAKFLSIKEIWNSEYYNNLRNLHLNQKRKQINQQYKAQIQLEIHLV